MGSELEGKPPANGNGNGAKPPRKLSGFASQSYWTPERREAQREQAKRLIAAGRLGGREFGKMGGRPKVKTATQLLAEKARDRAEKMDRKLNGMLDDRSPVVQAMAIDRYLAAEAKVEKDMREDERELAKLNSEELDTVLIELLMEATGQVPEEDAIEGDAVEVHDGND